ncbi:hypothetical protein B0H14DRAFT_2586761 [Mycena olivaceomarginata]|nr:hypothetical protein B0H14DRAFT_2586761 [Mycena olivaceomarginata]
MAFWIMFQTSLASGLASPVGTSARVLRILSHFIILTFHSVLGPPASNLLVRLPSLPSSGSTVQPPMVRSSGLLLPPPSSDLRSPTFRTSDSSLQLSFHLPYLPAVIQTGWWCRAPYHLLSHVMFTETTAFHHINVSALCPGPDHFPFCPRIMSSSGLGHSTRKIARWIAAANAGTASPSEPGKRSKTLTKVEDKDSDKFNGDDQDSGSGSDSESE